MFEIPAADLCIERKGKARELCSVTGANKAAGYKPRGNCVCCG